MKAERPRLVLLDLMLPDTDSIELMRTVPALAELPVIFISGYGRDETVAQALEAGADDYIVKPFSPTELTARVRAALRRRSEPERFVLGKLSIDYESRRARVGARDVALTVTEFELLRALSLNAGRISTHQWLLARVWAARGHDDQKIVRAYVKRLRRKLGDDAANPVDLQRARRGLPHAAPGRGVASTALHRPRPERGGGAGSRRIARGGASGRALGTRDGPPSNRRGPEHEEPDPRACEWRIQAQAQVDRLRHGWRRWRGNTATDAAPPPLRRTPEHGPWPAQSAGRGTRGPRRAPTQWRRARSAADEIEQFAGGRAGLTLSST